MMFVEIYGLCDPDTGELRYIGKANNAEARLKSHIRDARRRRTPVYIWMNRLTDKGKRPSLRILQTVCADEWEQAEREAIATARANGVRLLNLAEGGDQPFCSREVRSRNGSRTSQTRHYFVWFASRTMGQNAKWLRENVGEDAYVRSCQKVDRFRKAVERNRKAGTLDILNERLRELFIARNWYNETSRAA